MNNEKPINEGNCCNTPKDSKPSAISNQPPPAPNKQEEKITKTKLEKLNDLVAIQKTDGNWDYNPYMHGLANGLILAKSIMEDKRPVYLAAPYKWISKKEKIFHRIYRKVMRYVRKNKSNEHMCNYRGL